VVAPVSVALMVVAQAASGLFMTSLEGLLDTTAAARAGTGVTGALARGTAARALGSAAATAALPVAVSATGLSATSAVLVGVLLVAAVCVRLTPGGSSRRVAEPPPVETYFVV